MNSTPLGSTQGGSGSFATKQPRRGVVLAAVLSLVLVLACSAVLFRHNQTGTPAGGAGTVGAVPTPSATAPGPEVPVIHPGTGVFRGTDPREVREYGAWLGRDVQYVIDFPARATWQDIAAPQYLINAWKGTPYRKVYSIPMLPQDPSDTAASGATGEYDGYFEELAHRLVAGGQQDTILRLGWEFNLGDSAWSSDDSRDFVGYWRRIVAVMRSVPGQSFEFDWNPNNGDTRYDAVNYYPGDDVVDYVGVDAYDIAYTPGTYPYPANCDQKCRSRRQATAWGTAIYGGTRGLRFWSQFAAGHEKPLTLPEWGLWQRQDGHGGGDDPDYLRRMADFIADQANNVAFQSYFEVDGDDGTHRLMTTYAQDGDLFRSLFGAGSANP